MTDVDMGVGNLTGNGSSMEETVGGIAPEVEAVTSPAPQPSGDADLTVEPDPQQPRAKVVIYQEWVAAPNLKIFVPESSDYANRAGWWRCPWRGDEAAVRALGYEPKQLIHTEMPARWR